jgi:hypothetical protein
MTEKEEQFEQFLYDNDIKCETCYFNARNTPIPYNHQDKICGNELNRQTNVYSGQWLQIKYDGVCKHWKEFKEKDDEQTTRN